MGDVTVSVRVSKDLHDQMKLHDEINWSGVIRKTITHEIEGLHRINTQQAQQAAREIKHIRDSGICSGGQKAEDIIRAWRDKRK